jgi:hypothetical protein
MKNVFLIPTNEVSNLTDCHDNKLHLNDTRYLREYLYIYIINDERPKRHEYFINNENKVIKSSSDHTICNHKKIVLTNDPKLETVQQLTEEQLKEFVNNPCEFVEVEHDYLLWKKSEIEKLSDCYSVSFSREKIKQKEKS